MTLALTRIMVVTALTLDNIGHDTRIRRLSASYNICGLALRWLSSYLTDRQQAINIGTCSSDMLPTSCRIPQGSVLGSLLFTLYYNATKLYYQSSYHLYAYISLDTPDTYRSLIQLRDYLHVLWMENSNLKLNADKTEYLIFGTPTQRRKLDGFFATHIFSQSITATSVLYVEVTFDENLNSTQHISNTCRCCFYSVC